MQGRFIINLRLRALFAAVVTLSAALVAIMPAAQAQEQFHHVGVLEGNEDAFVAVVTDGTQIIAYICDGTPEGGVSIWGWFHGRFTEGDAALVSTNGHLLELELFGGIVSGQMTTRDGETLPFRLAAATDDTGLFAFQGVVDGEHVLAGVIILPPTLQERGASIRNGTPSTAAIVVELDKNVLPPTELF